MGKAIRKKHPPLPPWRLTKQLQEDIEARREIVDVVRREVEIWEAEGECRHGRLPGDPSPHIGVVPIGYHLQGRRLKARYGPPVRCCCWDHWTVGVNTADKLLEAVATLTQQVEDQKELIERLIKKADRVDRNLLAFRAEFSRAGDNGR